MLQLLDKRLTGSNLRHQHPQTSLGQYAVATCADRPDLFEASVALENEVWDRLSFLDYSKAHHAHYDTLLEQFPATRLCMIETETGEMVATGMSLPVHIDRSVPLPDGGWDWIVEKVAAEQGKDANTLAGLTISVAERHRQSGFAQDIINAMRALAAMNGFSEVLIPVRPNSKCLHPTVSMEEYITWRDVRGRIFDPWLRNQVSAAGAIVGVCARSMVVEQPIAFWESWTNSKIEASGQITLEGALAPIDIDLPANVGTYVEPNVWVSHRV